MISFIKLILSEAKQSRRIFFKERLSACSYCFFVVFSLSSLIFLFPSDCKALNMTAITCNAPIQTTSRPRVTFRRTCQVDIKSLKPTEKPGKLGVSLSTYTTSKTSGNGGNINVTSPENPIYRFRVIGTEQGGNPANITTNELSTNTTIIQDNINTTGIYSFDLLYTAYEADTGATSYSHTVNLNYYRKNSSTYLSRSTYNFTFTTLNFGDVSISGPLSISLLPSQVYTLNTYYDSNTVTISVYANNTWALQTEISGYSGLSHYFRASGSGFDNLAPSRTPFLQNNTLYNVAKNINGIYTTGSSNGIYLNPLYVMLTYSYYNQNVLNAGVYSYNTVLNINSP